jgi:ribosomal protein L28
MSLDNFRNRTIIWDTVNKDFPQPIQIMQGDVNARTLLIKIVDNGVEIDLTGHSLKLTYQYTNSSNSGFVMIPPKDLAKGEFILVIPTEMTATGVIEANLILLNKDKEQVIVSKKLTFISDSSTVSVLAQKINNNIDDFTKLLLEKMPQVLRSELNDLHAQTDSNKSNIELKANLADMTSLQSAMTELKNEVEAFGISPENLVTIKSLLDAIASNASESELVELINSVKVLTSNISLMSNGDYSPKANQTDLESLQHTVNNQSAAVSTKANQTDLDNLQATVEKQGIAISTKAEQSDLSTTNKNVTTAQETANKAESEAKNAMAKATEAQANSLPLNSNAVSASKLATARKLGVNLQSSSPKDFDGSSDVTDIGVTGVLPIANGGTSTSDGVINTIAYANSADGTDDFTTVYPNLNLLKNTRTLTATSTSLAWNTLFSSSQIYDPTIKSKTGVSAMNFSFSVYVPLNVAVGSGVSIQLKGQNSQAPNVWGDDHNTIICLTNYIIKQSDLGKTIRISAPVLKGDNYINFDTALADTDSITIRQATDTPGFVYSKLKLEEGSIATPWMPSASEVTTADYPKYVGFSNSIKPNKKSSDYNWLPLNSNAVSASKLATPRKLGVNLQSSSFQDFDGTADAANIGVSGVLPIANGGTSTSDGVIDTIAYANSADGTDDFTTVYPNLNLIDGTKDFSGSWGDTYGWTNDGIYKGLTVKKRTNIWGGIHKKFIAPKDGTYTFSAYVKSSGNNANIVRYVSINSIHSQDNIGNNFDWVRNSKTLKLKARDEVFISYNITGSGPDSILWTAGHKWEEGSIATPYMPSASEVTTADYPKYVGFSNSIKPNKKSSDYKWLPMWLVSIDRATGSLKPAVIGIDCAQAHPVGSVVTNTSSSSSGYSTGKWENIGSAVIGSTTIYYWKRTA